MFLATPAKKGEGGKAGTGRIQYRPNHGVSLPTGALELRQSCGVALRWGRVRAFLSSHQSLDVGCPH